MPLPQGSKISIIKPDDFHVHFRQGEMLKLVAPFTAKTFARAIAMPNTVPPIKNTEMAQKYFEEIQSVTGKEFTPLMTLYFTEDLTKEEIRKAKESGLIKAVKLYPKGATTNSESGISDLETSFEVLEEMEKQNLPLLIHGEVVEGGVDIFDREKRFVDTIFTNIIRRFPNLRIVLEHVTTKHAADFVKSTSVNIAVTVTAHHLHINRNHILVGGIRPHYYCLPIAKREEDRLALIEAVTSGNKKFFAGTDTAPHPRTKKECACGCAGIFTAHAAVELYAEIFDQKDSMQNFEAFMSTNGAEFYGLPLNSETITLVKEIQDIPSSFGSGETEIIPFRAGEKVEWKLLD